jgi:hypothetical protein
MTEPEKPKPPFDARDGIGAVGLALLSLGCWFVWPPLAAIVPGAVLLYVSIFGAR